MDEDTPSSVTPRAPGRRSGTAATIYDVARLAGVNPSTVSRALNGRGRVGERTQARIREAAQELRFRHNPAARGLPTGRYHTIALMVADITNPVFALTVRGAEQALTAAGYTLLLVESRESGERESAAVARVLAVVDAVILVGSRLADERIEEIAQEKPTVVVNREVDGVASVVPDLAPGIADLLSHLAGLGHTSLAYVSGPSTSWMSAARWDVLLTMAPDLGMTIVEIGPNRPTVDGGRATHRRVAASGVTAVVTYNDLMAIGLLQAMQLRGLAVPDTLSVAGFDDIFGSAFITPPLTTVRTSLGSLGARAAKLALGQIGVATVSPSTETSIRTELLVRGSTGTAPAAEGQRTA